MYYLYIDESGVEGLIRQQKQRPLDADWFTAGGIIVNDASIKNFEKTHQLIIENFFESNDINLSPDFRLHYHELRQNLSPYNQLTKQQRLNIANNIFNSINSIDCKLLSATINKPHHDGRYDWSVNVRVYTLLFCLERFQYFLEDENENGKTIYEKFSNNLRRKMTDELERLQNIPTFPSFTNLDKIKGKVRTGDPIEEKVLQFSDFFVYAPHIRSVTNYNADIRWRQIKERYYNLNAGWYRSGYVVRQ